MALLYSLRMDSSCLRVERKLLDLTEKDFYYFIDNSNYSY